MGTLDKKKFSTKDNVFASLENRIKAELLDKANVKYNHVSTKNTTNILHQTLDELLSHWKVSEDKLRKRRLSKVERKILLKQLRIYLKHIYKTNKKKKIDQMQQDETEKPQYQKLLEKDGSITHKFHISNKLNMKELKKRDRNLMAVKKCEESRPILEQVVWVNKQTGATNIMDDFKQNADSTDCDGDVS